MIVRQKIPRRITSFFSFFRKELLLIFFILLSLASGWYNTAIVDPDIGTVWEKKGGKEVKGASVLLASQTEQIREIEIIPAKYERSMGIVKPQGENQWGVSRQIDEYTWTMNVAADDTMATASDIVTALNIYRSAKGRGQLSYDQKLSEYAQMRANFFVSNGGMDSHAGFQDFISNQDGFNSLGFFSLGENSSFGYHLNGTHLIEWVFAGDAPHDNNQLNPEWTHVGVGVSEQAVDIIFGGRKR